jgi:hypothetical protein
MKEKLTEARDIVAEMMADVEGRYPIGLVRVGRILEELLEEIGESEWSWDDVITIPFPEEDDLPFPAA